MLINKKDDIVSDSECKHQDLNEQRKRDNFRSVNRHHGSLRPVSDAHLFGWVKWRRRKQRFTRLTVLHSFRGKITRKRKSLSGSRCGVDLADIVTIEGLVLVEGDASERLSDLRQTRVVILDGKLMDADALRTAAKFPGLPK